MRTQYLRNVSAQGLARAVQIVAGVVATLVVARALGPTALGLYAYALSFLTVAVGVADAGTTVVLGRGLGIHHGQDRSELMSTFLMLRAVLAVVAAAAAAAVAIRIAPVSIAMPLLWGCAALPLLASRFFDPLFQVSGRPWYSLQVTTAYGFVLIIGTIAGIGRTNALLWAITSYVLAGVWYAIHALVLAGRVTPLRVRLERTHARELLALALPAGISTFFALLNTRLPVFVLESTSSPIALGLFSAAGRFLDVAVGLIGTALTPLIPVLARLAVAGPSALVGAQRSMSRFIIVVCTPVAVITPLAAAPLLRLLFGAEFVPAAPVVHVIAWSALLICFGLSGTAVLLAMGRVGLASLNTAVATVLNLLLCVWWIPRFGIVGAAYAALCAEAYLVGAVFVLIRSRLGTLGFGVNVWPLLIGNGFLAILVHATPATWSVPATIVGVSLYITAIHMYRLLPHELWDGVSPSSRARDSVGPLAVSADRS